MNLPIIFNRNRKRQQIKRAEKSFYKSDFLYKESADRLVSQFDEIIVKKFKTALVLGFHDNYLIELLIERGLEVTNINLLESNTEDIDLNNQKFDLVINNLSLSWINDLAGMLFQIRRALKKDGFFCANIYGGKTLQELRESIKEVDAERGEASPRISPFVGVKDGAALLQRVHFAEPISVSEDLVIKYDDVFQLMEDIKNTGESNALEKLNSKFVGKTFFNKLNKKYKENFSDEHNNLDATCELVTISGWRT